MRLLLQLLFLLLPTLLTAAPMDLDGNGQSNPTVVAVNNQLDWLSSINDSNILIAESFGSLGNHLVPGKYLGTAISNLGYLKNDGTWTISTNNATTSISFGSPGSSYIGGGDWDGDGKDDLMHRTKACKANRSTAYFMRDPLGAQQVSEIKAGKGRFYSFAYDSTGDGSDELCFLKPKKHRGVLKPTFTMICKEALTGKRIRRARIGRVFSAPLALKQNNGTADLLALVRAGKSKTRVVIRTNTGKKIDSFLFNNTGTMLVGNFTNSDSTAEQVALYEGAQLHVRTVGNDSAQTLSAPDGIPVDEINNVHFESQTRCYCTSKEIKQNNGRCSAANTTPPEDDYPTGVLTGSCDVNRDVTDGNENFLHKPVAENSASIVNLFPRSDDPSACWYENKNNNIIGNAYSSGYSNPDRPTFRPTNGARCGSFPNNFFVACNVRGQKHCWQIPHPCSRYD